MKKAELPFSVMVPSHPMAKPGVGVAPTSHWNCVVGGVRMQPRPMPSVMPIKIVSTLALDGVIIWLVVDSSMMILTSIADTVFASRKAGVSNTVLA